MDFGFLSNLLGGSGKDNSMITALLPLLLGGKFSSSGGMDPSETIRTFFKVRARENEGGYPPLFGGQNAGKGDIGGGIFDMLGKMIKPQAPKEEVASVQPDYPYELQYNRPYQP